MYAVLALLAGAAPVWHADLDDAAALAARLDRPLFVVFRCEH